MSDYDAGPAPDEEVGDDHPSKRDMLRDFLQSKESWAKGVTKSKDELLKGKLMLEHSLGLGPQPNIIPPGWADVRCPHRAVEIGWHPVAGFAGKWLAEKTGLGKFITEKIHKYPDPTQHWAILVGDYVHELWMDEHLDVIYINEQIKRDEWHTFEVGRTRFNDEALRQAGEMVIYNMRAKKAAYNLISNNCQTFALQLLDSIQVGAHQEFATSFQVYQAATGKGKIADLFVDKPPEEPDEDEEPGTQHQNAMQHAQQVIHDNTTHLDNHLECC